MNETPRWLTPAEQRAWRSFVRMQQKLQGRLSRRLQADSGLSEADYTVLVELTDAPDGRRRFLDLAKAVEWEKSRMSHHITRMTKRGLVTRVECPEDGRGAFVVITPAGHEAIRAAAPLHVEAVREMFLDHVTPAELDMLGHLCERVVDRLDAPSHPAEQVESGA
ncbi:MarR family winged helix-turn-helix transcriptional regulator [Streptomyces litchfieldiae]|uniref:MarR family winged helix-turn-helix transcriptional regulator n=1 Tax=Streptomyces litchfieldiae TaxID=3075543 RepID=A0ABU2MS87_9ACTN|nr:MarR family winged helix-turn-helix transcriptional regulator [Streptomyces sp. DSM 44938]MDT0344496.1 MarR family winged helix-turn-helix transcriptional regulator [Streptomyces sp. DSM 44938]